MAKKIKLNLNGLKNQIKTGVVTIEYLNGKVDYPIKLKNDREYKNIINLADYKYKTKLVDNKLVTTNLQKLSNIKAEYRDIIVNSEGYTNKDISYVKIYDENELLVAKNDRETMLEGVMVVAHLDLDYIVDDKNNKTFLDLINETFEDLLKEKFNGSKIEREDYYRVTEILFEANLISYEIINVFILHIRALKNGRTIEEEKYRQEAMNMGIQNEEDIQKWLKVREDEKKLNELREQHNDIIEEVELKETQEDIEENK